jgi:3-oxoacyl-[acyl-carrier protein] reductase
VSTTGVSAQASVSGPIDLAGRVAIVTGAARGIGQAIAGALAREGADVALADVLPVDKTATDVRDRGRRALEVACDVTKSADVANVVTRCLDEFGKIDILVNNAGVLSRVGLEDTTEEIWYRDVDVLMTGAYRMTKAVFPSMKERGYGKIVNISSVSGKIGGAVSKTSDSPDALFGRSGPAYAAAKGGVLAFTKWVAKDAGRYGIHSNAVCPGGTDTDMTRGFDYGVESLPIARMAKPEDIAEAVVFLASQASNFITGQALNVDGGLVMD